MDHSSSELIESQMAKTRQSLTEKVTALEDSVVGTVQTATTAVQDTVHTVQAAVEGAVDSVRRQLQSALDVRRHVRENPWWMMAGASAAGFVAGRVCSAGPRLETSPVSATRAVSHVPSPSRPAVWDSLIESVGNELKKVGESTIHLISARLRQMVQDGISATDSQSESKQAEAERYPIGRWNGTGL